MGFAGEVLGGVAGDGEVETDAEGEEEVAVLEGEVGAAGGYRAGAADVGGVVGRDEIGGAPGGNGGNAEEGAELFELGLGAGEADAVAGEQERALAGVEGLDSLLDLVGDVRGACDRGIVGELGGVEGAELGVGMGEAWTSRGMSIQTGPGRPWRAR